MKLSSSIVLVDKRHYRKIAQENWGLTDEQMQGMHIHHRIPRSAGGTNDPTNLYVCSPSYHRWVWHCGEEWIEWASKGAEQAASARARLRQENSRWKERESERNKKAAVLSHSKRKGTLEYSQSQREKSIRSHPAKRKHWTIDEYETVWDLFMRGYSSGYKIGRELNSLQHKKYRNMLHLVSLGLTFEQIVDVELYVKEITRLDSSLIAHILDKYDD